MKLAQTSGTTIVVFLARHLTKRLMDPDVCVLLKCVFALFSTANALRVGQFPNISAFSLSPASSSVSFDNDTLQICPQGQDLCTPVTWCDEVCRKIWHGLSSVSIQEWKERKRDAL